MEGICESNINCKHFILGRFSSVVINPPFALSSRDLALFLALLSRG